MPPTTSLLRSRPSRPDRLADARALAVDDAGYFLESGARGSDHSDRTAADDIGKAERLPVDDGSPAIRTHDQEAFVAAEGLEGHLVIEGDVVREQHDVESLSEGLARFPRRKGTRKGDDGQVRTGKQFDCGCDARGQGLPRAPRLPFAREHFRGSGEGCLDSFGIRAIHGGHEVIRADAREFRAGIAHGSQEFEVHGRAHGDYRVGYPFQVL